MRKICNTVSRSQSKEVLTLSQGLAYASPTIATAFLLGPIVILQGIYAKHFGLTLTTIATVILVARLFDAITDPIIGYFSDRYQVCRGSRKPFVVAGGLLFILSSYFLYIPPTNVSEIYLLGWLLLFYLAWTLFEIPHLAWGSELVTHTKERNKIYSLRVFGMLFGQLFFFAVPLLPIFDSNEFTPQTLKWSVLVAALLMIPLLYLCAKVSPDGQRYTAVNSNSPRYISLGTLCSVIISNKPFLIFVGAFFFSGIGVGMWFGLLFIFADSYLGLGNNLPFAFLISIGISTLTLGGCYKIGDFLGKKTTWGVVTLMMTLGIAATGFLVPGEFVPLLIVMTLNYIGFSFTGVLAPSLLADIIDYGTWKSGIDQRAIYFSIKALMVKANIAVGGALGLAIAGSYGFDPATAFHTQESIFGLHLAIAGLPSLITLISIIFIAFIPINTRRHLIIRRCLDARQIRSSASS